jgi:hypothetical protein
LKLRDLIVRGEFGRVHYIYVDQRDPNFGRPDSFTEAIAAIITLFGELPCQVSMMPPSSGPAMQTMTLLSFSKERRAHFFSGQPLEDRLVVCGDEKAAVLTFNGQTAELAIHNQPAAPGEKVPLLRNSDSIPIAIPPGDSVQALCEAFVSSCECREPTASLKTIGIGILKVMAALRTSSIQQGVPVTVLA